MRNGARPLTGLRVLDFSRLFPGPYCTMLLAEMGAEVIKVEDTGQGDLLRQFPPLIEGAGALFCYLNRGKQSVALDLKAPAGRAVAHRLTRISQVVVEGFRPGVAERLGIDFPALSALNPTLVYCSISGYGQKGDFRDLPGHDLTYAAMSGLLQALSPDEPRVPGVQLVDAASGLLAAIRILAALQATASGPQFLDVSLYEASQVLMPGALAEALAGSSGPSLMSVLRGSPRNDLYRCADGAWLGVSPIEEHFWQNMSAALRAAGLIQPDQPVTTEVLRDVFAQRPCAEWCAFLGTAGVPCAPVRSVAEAVPRDLELGPVPTHGEHTEAWLEKLGYAPEDVAAVLSQNP